MSSNLWEKTQFLKQLNQSRVEGTGCDVSIQIGETSFIAHRIVLVTRLEYFKNLHEDKTWGFVLDSNMIDLWAFEEVLNYIYTFEINFTVENFRPIYQAALYLGFKKLMDEAETYLKTNLQINNVLLYMEIAADLGLKSVEDHCEMFMFKNHSSDILKTEVIPLLSYECLERLFQRLRHHSKQEDIFHNSMEWILHGIGRADNLPELIRSIPFESLSFRFLKEVVSKNDIIMNNVECLKLLVNALANKPRTDTLYAIGGCCAEGLPLSSVSIFDSQTREWIPTTPMPSKRTYFGCAVIGQRIYVCGGYDGIVNMNEFTVFETRTRTWKQLSPMKHSLHGCGVAALNGQIYVAGGYDDGKALDFLERYSVERDEWENLPSMDTKRHGFELVEMNGYLYAIGGHDGKAALKTVERFDPQNKKWKQMRNTNNTFEWFGSAVLDDDIYIVGGSTCEVYSPAKNKWTIKRGLNENIEGNKITVYNRKLFSIGGRLPETWEATTTMQWFNFRNRTWVEAQNLDAPRSFHALAVVKNEYPLPDSDI